MKSIRTKITLLTVSAIVVAMTIATVLGISAIRSIGNSDSEQMLLLLCEAGEKNLDSYFESVEQSASTLSAYVREDLQNLTSLDAEQLAGHVERVDALFEKAAAQTNGVLTYYYRIDPTISETIKGFWYTNLDGNGFQEHEVTDITKYDTEDTSKLVWFTVPKATGHPVWLPPYVTDNLDVRVFSYNVPIYWNGKFVGVVGIEIDYSTMAEQVDNIELYKNGYAFINDNEGTIIYHPHIDTVELAENHPKVPDGLLSDDTFVTYTYNGVEKQAVWLPLSNGMRLNVTVPTSEINGNWHTLMNEILVVSVIVLLIFIALTMRLAGTITKPLRELADVAKQVDEGNYDIELKSESDDEVGTLTHAFSQLVEHLKVYIGDLNNLAYADSLTSLRNRGAFEIHLRGLQARLDDNDEHLEFAVGMFDCDGLKLINDRYGHDKGNIYLRTASHLICRIFQHTPVFRIGGDEFAAILQGDDFRNRDDLVRQFEEKCAEMCASASNPWEEVHVSLGISVYDPQTDRSVDDVSHRADMLMYEHKRARKAEQEDAS